MRWLLAFAVVLVGCRAPAQSSTAQTKTSARAIRIEHPSTYWAEHGFVEMAPTVPLATDADGSTRITVWARLPDGPALHARGNVPRYGAGTVVDRVVFDSGKVADVRGTEFGERGETFHVLHPDPSRPGTLEGVEWDRDDEAGAKVATNFVVTLACHEPNSDVAFVKKRSQCVQCHMHDKPARRIDLDDDIPFGATDDGGLYQILAVLRDDGELDDSRGRDLAIENRETRIHCESGAPRVAKSAAGEVHVLCAAPHEVPIASYDLRAALREGDPHARAVCASRAYLFAHADEDAKKVFAHAFRECDLG